jgi:3-oxoadipate enol-lactonase
MIGTTIQGEARTRDGVSLSYSQFPAEEGAPRLALVHSLALDRSLWSGVVELLRGKVDIVTDDCRGHGRSGQPAGPYSTEQFADDLADLFDHLGWDTATVAGCSMGGCVAQQFASAYRDRTDAALFVDTTAWYGPTAPADWAGRAAKARERGLPSLIPFQLTRWFGDAFREANPDLLSQLTAVFTANNLECYEATCAMLGAADLRESASSIAHPAAVVVGEDDAAAPPAMAHELAERIGDGPAIVVPGARHLTPLENPEAVVEVLATLFDRVTSRQR